MIHRSSYLKYGGPDPGRRPAPKSAVSADHARRGSDATGLHIIRYKILDGKLVLPTDQYSEINQYSGLQLSYSPPLPSPLLLSPPLSSLKCMPFIQPRPLGKN